jgi:hypothetical protein
MSTPIENWAAAKQKIQELDTAAQEPARAFLEASRNLWRHELTNRYPQAKLSRAKIVIRVQSSEEPSKVVALGEAIIARGGTVTEILESEGHFYVVVN